MVGMGSGGLRLRGIEQGEGLVDREGGSIRSVQDWEIALKVLTKA